MASSYGLRRSSRLAQRVEIRAGVADHAKNSPATCTPYLPAEVKSLVAECLHKSDLKSLRYVSKQWHALATPLLFDKIYISPRDKDIQVFSNITQHPYLGSCIKEMICDMSWIPELTHEEYFYDLCDELKSMTYQLSRKFSFKSPHPRLNEFVNAIIRARMSQSKLFSKYASDLSVIEGFQTWQQLAAQESQALKSGSHGKLSSDLCSGLYRLSNLRSVKMDDNLWDKTRRDMGRVLSPTQPHHTPSAVLSGSPLVPSWILWHLRPKKSEYEKSNLLRLVIMALSRTERSIASFDCHSRFHRGLPPMRFAVHSTTRRFRRHMTDALWQLQRLDLQITPRKEDFINHENAKALDFLQQLLEKMTSLKSLSLVLFTAKRIKKSIRLPRKPLNDTCYTYLQVFPHLGKWQHLEYLALAGLGIDALDMHFLLFNQMPRLQRLDLNRIDLLEGRWDGVVEMLRIRGAHVSWKLLGLLGSFRHEGDQWWPCPPYYNDGDRIALEAYTNYAQEGGRHPGLPASSEDWRSINYYNEMFYAAGPERLKALGIRAQQVEDRLT